MKLANILFCSLIAIALSNAIPPPQKSLAPATLPQFLGKSYDILNGNILSNGVDPGFMHNLFQFTYNKKETTEDGKYWVPDGVSHSLLSACSFQSDSQVFRGTKSYQQHITQKADLKGGYKGLMVQASFSFSQSYEKMASDTSQSKKSIIHTSSQCQAYKLEMDMFKIANLSANFILGVRESFKSGDWTKFIGQFGTHYVYDVILGARASQATEYSYESTQKMQSLNIDVKFAAKAKYAEYYADASFEYNKYKEQISYSEKISTSINEFYVGNPPAKGKGDLKEWATLVYNNPMPIRIKLYDLGQLFQHIDKLDYKKARISFYKHLDVYCKERQCKNSTADLPQPPPATNNVLQTASYGGSGGTTFTSIVNTTTISVKKFLIGLNGSRFINFQILLGDEVKSLYSIKVGWNAATIKTWDVPDGQFISQIQFYSDNFVQALIFITNKGVKSPMFGSALGSFHLFTLPTDYRIIGIYGKSGQVVDRLGFYIAKTIYHPREQPIKFNLFTEK